PGRPLPGPGGPRHLRGPEWREEHCRRDLRGHDPWWRRGRHPGPRRGPAVHHGRHRRRAVARLRARGRGDGGVAMPGEPLLSVIVPTVGRPSVERAVNSLLRQCEWLPYDVILVGDLEHRAPPAPPTAAPWWATPPPGRGPSSSPGPGPWPSGTPSTSATWSTTGGSTWWGTPSGTSGRRGAAG